MNNLGFIAEAEKTALKDISKYHSQTRGSHLSSNILLSMGKKIRKQNRLLTILFLKNKKQ